MSLVIDKSGFGPPLSIGAKADLNQEHAMIGSIEESLLTRPWLRKKLYDQKNVETGIKPYQITTLLKRSLYWWNSSRISEDLEFLLSSNNEAPIKITRNMEDSKKELTYVLKLLKRKGFKVFYSDLTRPPFKQCGCFVYKVVIPGTQPLYLNEKYREINTERLAKVAKYFKIKKCSINSVPHPFL